MHSVLIWLAALGAPFAQDPSSAPTVRPARISTAAVDAAIERGSRFLARQQRGDGVFAPLAVSDVCPVALTAVALWSLAAPEPFPLEAEARERAVGFLLAHRRADGGIYDPTRGLAVYTSGVAARALHGAAPFSAAPDLKAALSDVELFTYRRRAPESVTDAALGDSVAIGRTSELARELLNSGPQDDAARRKALEFLARSARDPVQLPSRIRGLAREIHPSEIGPFTYDDLLPLVYTELSPEQQLALRVRAALGAYYTPDRNPDLTKRYGAAGFSPGSQGLYYYYFIAAKVLTAFRERELVTADGARHPWAAELATRLVRMQREDGAWANSDPSWWESEPLLATSYALLTLKLCRASLQGP